MYRYATSTAKAVQPSRTVSTAVMTAIEPRCVGRNGRPREASLLACRTGMDTLAYAVDGRLFVVHHCV